MERSSLAGRSILIVEDEPLIVMDITDAFGKTGAELTSTNTLSHAMLLVEDDALSGAILDHAFPDGDSSLLRTRLKERGIPFLIYSGYREADIGSHGAPYISKPAPPKALVDTMVALIRRSEISRISATTDPPGLSTVKHLEVVPGCRAPDRRFDPVRVAAHPKWLYALNEKTSPRR